MSFERDLPIRAAIALGITGSSFVAAINLAMTTITIPSLLRTTMPTPTPVLLTQWEQHYAGGKSQALPVIGATLVGYGYAIYRIRSALALGPAVGAPSWELLVGGVAAIFCVPAFTVLFMEGPFGSVNSKLHEMRKEVAGRVPVEASEVEGKRARELCRWWAVMCGMRAIFPLAASVLGIWAAI